MIGGYIKTNLEIMKKNFKDAEDIYAEHKSWPLRSIHQNIEHCIDKCKEEIQKARSHTGAGRHKLNVEAVHAKRIDTEGWDFEEIYKQITQFAHQAKPNHLKLDRPHHHKDGTHLFVNVVLAWLFAAKRQLMSNLAVYCEQLYVKDAAVVKFLEHENKAHQALTSFHHFKKMLPEKKHKSYVLQDQNLLDEQYAALHK